MVAYRLCASQPQACDASTAVQAKPEGSADWCRTDDTGFGGARGVWILKLEIFNDLKYGYKTPYMGETYPLNSQYHSIRHAHI